MAVIHSHRALRALRALAAAVLLVTALSSCELGTELEHEAHPEPTARQTVPSGVPSGAPTGVRSGTTTPSPSRTSCPPSGLRATAGLVDAAAGLRAMTVTVTDCTGHAVDLNGYPSLRVLDEEHEPVDVDVVRGMGDHTGVPDPGPAPLTLRPGGSAYTVLLWRNTVTSATTPAVRAPYLAVGADEQRPAGTVRPDGGLDLGTTGRLFSTAWQPTDSGTTVQHP